MSGIKHFKNHAHLTGYAAAMKVPQASLAVFASGVLLLLGGLGILFGVYTNIAAWLLIIFLVPTTLMIHSFWKMSDPQTRMGNEINFYKNLALIGALLMYLHY